MLQETVRLTLCLFQMEGPWKTIKMRFGLEQWQQAELTPIISRTALSASQLESQLLRGEVRVTPKNGQNHAFGLFLENKFNTVFSTHILSVSTQKTQIYYDGIPLSRGKYDCSDSNGRFRKICVLKGVV